MKKRLLFVAAAFAATATFAQDGLTSKKGEAYLPEAGDWAIGIDANPLLNYVGNMANQGNNTGVLRAGWFGGVPEGTIYGKMFKDEKTAYRAMVRIGFGSSKSGQVVNLFSDSIAMSQNNTTEYVNETKNSGRQITLGFGLEKRRGNTRIQGLYGAQALIGFGGSSTEYTYGLGMSNSSVETINGTAINAGYGAERDLKIDNGSTFFFGLQGFIGVEWFFAPKVSLGAEYSWGLS